MQKSYFKPQTGKLKLMSPNHSFFVTNAPHTGTSFRISPFFPNQRISLSQTKAFRKKLKPLCLKLSHSFWSWNFKLVQWWCTMNINTSPKLLAHVRYNRFHGAQHKYKVCHQRVSMEYLPVCETNDISQSWYKAVQSYHK